MDGRSEYDDALLLHFLLRVQWFDKLIFVLVIVAVLIIDEVSVGLIEVEGVYRSFGSHLLMLIGQVHLGVVFLLTAFLLLQHHRPHASFLGEGRVA